MIRTDHGALRWLLSFKNPEGQVARWIEFLGNYQFEIEHRPGKYHGNADGLSRRPCEDLTCKQCKRMKENDTEKTVHIPVKLPKSKVVVQDDDDDEVKFSQDTAHSDAPLPRISAIRRNANQTQNSWIKSMSNEEMREAQLKDPEIGGILRRLANVEGMPVSEIGSPGRLIKYREVWDDLVVLDGVLHKLSSSDHWDRKPLIVLPQELRKCALLQLHNARAGAHLGRKKTLRKMRERYYWPGCYRDVISWVRNCPECVQKRKPEKHRRAPMTPHRIENRMERISMDILGPLPESERGNRYILCMGDHFTKWITSVPIPNQETITVANAVIEHVISVFGVPKEIYTDQGRNFESKLFQELCDLLGIQKSHTVPYRAQSNGYIENFNKFLGQTLRLYCDKNQRDWDVHLPYIMLAYRTSVHASTGYTPAEMMLGFNPVLPIDLVYGTSQRSHVTDVDEFVESQREYMDKVHEIARENANVAREEQKCQYDKSATKNVKQFHPGDHVWYYRPRRYPGRSPKLQKDWEGPYYIVTRLSQTIYRIGKNKKKSKKDMVVHVDKLQEYAQQTMLDSPPGEMLSQVPSEIRVRFSLPPLTEDQPPLQTSSSGRHIRKP